MSTNRVALHSILRVGQEEAYEAAHATVPEDLANALRKSGIEQWTIWRSGRHLFHQIECADFPRALSILERDPADIRWQAQMSRFVESFLDEAGEAGEVGVGDMREVWSLSSQTGP